jgi:hypothetical protein
MIRFVLLLSGLAVATGPAWADGARDALKEISKCSEIASGLERLKCFDAAVPKAQTALGAPEPAPQQGTQTEADTGGVMGWFGFSRPVKKTEDFGKPPVPVASEHDLTSISATVTDFAKNAYGRALFILDNGQIWKQVDGDSKEVEDFREGEKPRVTIETGSLGGYSLTIAGRVGIVKVRRIR